MTATFVLRLITLTEVEIECSDEDEVAIEVGVGFLAAEGFRWRTMSR
ncbi:hypothetical protein PC121_g23101 [Phytophthora cactorum]|nr:hypothetical protein PC120_g27565 [Phytophthora cactorum]KAG3042455.1 hypothetical protein PC121_g23101 [Phytophthora cactorum]